MNAKIIFADNSFIELHESDLIFPVVPMELDDKKFATIEKPVELYFHIHDGLIPSIMDALCFCDFFYINGNRETLYCKSSIIKIEVF